MDPFNLAHQKDNSKDNSQNIHYNLSGEKKKEQRTLHYKMLKGKTSGQFQTAKHDS